MKSTTTTSTATKVPRTIPVGSTNGRDSLLAGSSRKFSEKEMEQEEVFSVGLMVGFALFAILLSQILYELGSRWFQCNSFTRTEYLHLTVTSVFTLVGGMKLYLYVQETLERRYFKGQLNLRILDCFVDDLVPVRPDWIWAYTMIDFVIMSFLFPSARDMGEATRVVFGMLVVVCCQCVFFIILPTTIPPKFRDHSLIDMAPGHPWSKAFLKLVHRVDGVACAFPSGHCSLAMYFSMCVFHVFGWWSLLNPLLIAASCVYTKQHVFADTVAGITFGYLIFLVVH